MFVYRILRFHRVPPTAGRLINVTHDIRRHADKKLLKTFFTSPGKIIFQVALSLQLITKYMN